MLDKFLEVGAYADLITPLCAFVKDMFKGTACHIGLPIGPVSAGTIERSLRREGVDVWGVMVVGDTILLSVKKSQERHTMECLRYWGVL